MGFKGVYITCFPDVGFLPSFQSLGRMLHILKVFFHVLNVRRFQCLFQGQFLLDNIIDKDKTYEFPVELMVRI